MVKFSGLMEAGSNSSERVIMMPSFFALRAMGRWAGFWVLRMR